MAENENALHGLAAALLEHETLDPDEAVAAVGLPHDRDLHMTFTAPTGDTR